MRMRYRVSWFVQQWGMSTSCRNTDLSTFFYFYVHGMKCRDCTMCVTNTSHDGRQNFFSNNKIILYVIEKIIKQDLCRKLPLLSAKSPVNPIWTMNIFILFCQLLPKSTSYSSFFLCCCCSCFFFSASGTYLEPQQKRS